MSNNEPPRCDQTSNCLDESDEDNCRLLSMKVSHKSSAFLHVLFHVLVISYLFLWSPEQLQQEDCALQLWQDQQQKHPCEHQCLNVGNRHHQDWGSRPCVHLEIPPRSWMVILLNLTTNRACYDRYDYRIKYLNLKNTRSQNSLALEDVQRLWIPFLVFDNTEKNEATKVFVSIVWTDSPSPFSVPKKKIIGNQLELLVWIADSAQTEYCSTFPCVSVSQSQAWHLKFSR